MVDDVYDILTAISTTLEGRVAMCANRSVSALCKVVATNCYRTSIVYFASVGAYCMLFDFSTAKERIFHVVVCTVQVCIYCEETYKMYRPKPEIDLPNILKKNMDSQTYSITTSILKVNAKL